MSVLRSVMLNSETAAREHFKDDIQEEQNNG